MASYFAGTEDMSRGLSFQRSTFNSNYQTQVHCHYWISAVDKCAM